MLKIQVRFPNGNVSDFDIDNDCAILGRAPESDVFLPSQQASRKHARVYVTGGTVFIEDLQSANGTFLRQDRLKVPTAITPEDPIKLGDVFIRVTLVEDSDQIPTSTGSYSLAQKLGDRRQTSMIGSDMGAELRRMFEAGEGQGQGPGPGQAFGGNGKKKS